MHFLSNFEMKRNRKLNWANVDTHALANFLSTAQAQYWHTEISLNNHNTDKILTYYADLSHTIKEQFFSTNFLPKVNHQQRQNWFDAECLELRSYLREVMQQA